MIKRFCLILILFILFFHPSFIQAKNQKNIEIFDPRANAVVEKIPLNEEISNEFTNWIKEIDQIHPAVNPIRDDGYAIKIPFDPALQIKNKWADIAAEEVYLIVPEKDPAFIVVFETENKPIFFIFPGKKDELSDLLKFKLD